MTEGEGKDSINDRGPVVLDSPPIVSVNGDKSALR